MIEGKNSINNLSYDNLTGEISIKDFLHSTKSIEKNLSWNHVTYFHMKRSTAWYGWILKQSYFMKELG